MLYQGNGGLLLSGSGLVVAVAIPIDESCGQSHIEKDAKWFFFAKGGRGHPEKYPLSLHTYDWHTQCF